MTQVLSADGGATSWSYPDPKWMAGATTIDQEGVPHHTARVVTYTTAAFDRDREFTGEGVLHLHASSDESDMDVMVKLSLLEEADGTPLTTRVTQGWLRASHRREDENLTTEMRPFLKHDRAMPIKPRKVYELRIELLPMSVLVRKGNRLRLEISNWESAQAEALDALVRPEGRHGHVPSYFQPSFAPPPPRTRSRLGRLTNHA